MKIAATRFGAGLHRAAGEAARDAATRHVCDNATGIVRMSVDGSCHLAIFDVAFCGGYDDAGSITAGAGDAAIHEADVFQGVGCAAVAISYISEKAAHAVVAVSSIMSSIIAALENILIGFSLISVIFLMIAVSGCKVKKNLRNDNAYRGYFFRGSRKSARRVNSAFRGSRKSVQRVNSAFRRGTRPEMRVNSARRRGTPSKIEGRFCLSSGLSLPLILAS